MAAGVRRCWAPRRVFLSRPCVAARADARWRPLPWLMVPLDSGAPGFCIGGLSTGWWSWGRPLGAVGETAVVDGRGLKVRPGRPAGPRVVATVFLCRA